ncbi:unnamed protein product [Ostreobium quekettii]|uniref:Uncharacterized protein n=1 Tax=Ostreobium quekettii TaxID=121088 RepID=A0A8S1IX36_9CHLO|nr:unnamed protein product [Ostreobium quekettii]
MTNTIVLACALQISGCGACCMNADNYSILILADQRTIQISVWQSAFHGLTISVVIRVPDDFHTPLDYYKELQAGAKANGLDLVPVIEAKLGKTHPLPMALRGDTEAAKANWQSMRKALTFQPQRSRGWNPALGGSAGSGVAEDKWGSLLAAAKEAKDTEGKAAAGAEEGPSASEERANVPKAAPAVAAAAATAVAPAAATAVAPVATKDQLAAPKDVPPATKDAAVANGTANAAAAEQEPGKEAKDVSKEKAVVPKDGSAEIRERGILLPQPIDGKNGKGLEAVGEKPKGDDDQENKPTVANRTRGVPASAAKDRGMRMPVRDETGGGNARGNKCCMCFGMR